MGDESILNNIVDLQTMSTLSLVVSDVSLLSTASVDRSDLASNRTLLTGTGNYLQTDMNTIVSKWYISDYLLDHYYSAQEQLELSETEMGLQYELEYILVGKDSDQENLESVASQLIRMRISTNYACLLQSVSKKLEVSTLALSIATAAQVPMLQPAIEQALLLGWAYGESVVDVRSLLAGNKVSLVKMEDQWQLSLESLLLLGTETDSAVGKDMEDGLEYEEFLRILLMLEEKDNVVMRALDMVEQRLRCTYGLEYFQVDGCITLLEFTNTSTVLGGYTYTFPVYFAYQ